MPNSKKSGRLIAHRTDRLGARVNSLVNARRIAEELDAPYCIYWVQSVPGHDSADINDPHELFDVDFIAEHFLSHDEWVQARPDLIPVGKLTDHPLSKIRRLLAQGKDVAVNNAFGITRFRNEDSEDVSDAFRKASRDIPLAASLVPQQSQIASSLANATAYHIRRGDLTTGVRTKHSAWPHKCIPDEFYQAHMRTELAQARDVILFSDDPDTVKAFSAQFPQLRTADDVIARDCLTIGQCDLLELFAMSCCSTIIAPEQSAFSTTAAELGGSRKIDVTEALGESQKSKAIVALSNRLRDRPETFANDGEIAQMLVHVSAWSDQTGDRRHFSSLAAPFVNEGLSISFIFPMLLRSQIISDDWSGAQALAERMDQVPIIQDKAFAEALGLRAAIELKAGRSQEALGHLLNAATISPRSRILRDMLSAALQTGLVGDRNFTVFPGEAPGMNQVGFKSRQEPELHAILRQIFDLDGAKHLPSPDILFLDQADIVGAGSVGKAMFRSHRARAYIKGSSKLKTVEGRVFHAALQLMEKRSHQRMQALVQLAEEHPNLAYAQFQLSRAHGADANWHEAAKIAAVAAEQAPDIPIYSAWAGRLAIKVRSYDHAARWLRFATETMPGVSENHAILADALHRNAQGEDALEAVARARRLVPTNSRYIMTTSRILESLGRMKEAAEVLSDIEMIARTSRQTYRRLAEIHLEMQNGPDALDAVEKGLELAPDFEPLLAIKAQLTSDGFVRG